MCASGACFRSKVFLQSILESADLVAKEVILCFMHDLHVALYNAKSVLLLL